MRSALILATAIIGVGFPAFAQTPAPSQGTGSNTGSSNPAVSDTGNAPSSTTSGTVNIVPASSLERGSNSFTEGQAKSRFEASGLTDVAALAKDDDGIWRATGKKDGKPVKLGLDYKGNIAAE